jgi:hypothetical protein
MFLQLMLLCNCNSPRSSMTLLYGIISARLRLLSLYVMIVHVGCGISPLTSALMLSNLMTETAVRERERSNEKETEHSHSYLTLFSCVCLFSPHPPKKHTHIHTHTCTHTFTYLIQFTHIKKGTLRSVTVSDWFLFLGSSNGRIYVYPVLQQCRRTERHNCTIPPGPPHFCLQVFF